MNRKLKRVPADFGPETRFEVRPAPPAPFRALQETALESLKRRLLLELVAEAEPRYNAPLRRAANEAASLAWVTPYPLLVFPGLLEEKAAAAVQQTDRQARIRQRSLQLMAA